MNILVTGGAGFIGSHLCEQLIKYGHRVVAVDNFDSLYPRSQKERNLIWLKQQKQFACIEADVRNKNEMEAIFSNYAFDYVFHLAGRGGIPQSTAEPFFYLEEIMLGTMVLLELSAKNNVRLFVNASSSSVYGNTSGEASKENTETDKPLSVYAACKKSSELLCHAYHALYSLGVANVRFFSVYGPRGRHDQVIYKFTKMIASETPIPNINPDPLRDFTYVDDIVHGLIAMMRLPAHSYEIINLGYGRPVSIRRIAELLEKALNKKMIIGETVRPMPSDTAITKADSSYARKLLHWKPTMRLEEGITKFVDWYLNSPQ